MLATLARRGLNDARQQGLKAVRAFHGTAVSPFGRPPLVEDQYTRLGLRAPKFSKPTLIPYLNDGDLKRALNVPQTSVLLHEMAKDHPNEMRIAEISNGIQSGLTDINHKHLDEFNELESTVQYVVSPVKIIGVHDLVRFGGARSASFMMKVGSNVEIKERVFNTESGDITTYNRSEDFPITINLKGGTHFHELRTGPVLDGADETSVLFHAYVGLNHLGTSLIGLTKIFFLPAGYAGRPHNHGELFLEERGAQVGSVWQQVNNVEAGAISLPHNGKAINATAYTHDYFWR